MEKSLGLLCLPGGSGDKLSRLAMFFYWSYCGLNCWSSHWRSHINERRGHCWLFRIIFVISGGEFFKMLDCQCRFPGILLLRIVFP